MDMVSVSVNLLRVVRAGEEGVCLGTFVGGANCFRCAATSALVQPFVQTNPPSPETLSITVFIIAISVNLPF